VEAVLSKVWLLEVRMAKEQKAFDVDAFLGGLVDGLDLPAEQVEAVKQTLAHEDVGKRLSEAVLMRSE
jgi:hypothetical protein